MTDLLQSVWRWLQGKKTYGAAAVIFAAAAYGYWVAYLPTEQTLLGMGLAMALVGMADKADRYGRLVLLALDQLKAAQQEQEKQRAEQQAKELGRGRTW